MSTQDSGSDQLPKDPTEVDVGCEIGAKLSRAYLRGIGRGESLKYAPRNPAKNFTHFKSDEILGEKREEDKTCNGH